MTSDNCNVAGLHVSRETYAALETYAMLLTKWNKKINLVSSSTITNLWSRHIIDCAQLYNFSRKIPGVWADLGSGGGLPGLVIAILARELNPDLKLVLVESDQRKATFLRTVIRETVLSVTVKNQRIESLAPLQADVVSARALAGLSQLLFFASRHMRCGGFCLFHKGKMWQKELAHARKTWSFDLERFTSVTAPEAAILKVGRIDRAG